MHVTLVPNDDAVQALNQKCTHTFKQLERDLERKDSEVQMLKGRVTSLEGIDKDNSLRSMEKDLE